MRASVLVSFMAISMSACEHGPSEPELSVEEGQRVHAAAVALTPTRPPGWQPETNARVMYRRQVGGAWELFDVLWDPPIVQGTLRELWQPGGKGIDNKARVSEVYPFPPAEQRPRAEAGAFVACIGADDDNAKLRGMRLARVLKRSGDMLDLRNEDGHRARVHTSDCILLQ